MFVSPSTPSECTYTSACVTESTPYYEFLQAPLIVAIPCAITPESKTPLFLPYHSPSARFPTRTLPQRNRANKGLDPLDIISFPFFQLATAAPTSEPAQDQETEQTADDALPHTAPPGARKSDYLPVKQRLRMRERQIAAKGPARGGRQFVLQASHTRVAGCACGHMGQYICVLHKSRRGEEDGKRDGGSAG